MPERGRRARGAGSGEPQWHELLGAADAPRGGTDPVSRRDAPVTGWARLWRDVREVVGTVVVALVIAVVVKTFLVQPFYIPSESMESTLLVGDRVLVSKLDPGPFTLERGDVVVFVDPGGWLAPRADAPSPAVRALTFIGLLPANSGEHLIKRVIGLPGDTVRCCDEEGRLLVNGEPVDEPYLFEGDVPSTLDFEVLVPEGRLWVMGDHRSVSEDSRYHVGEPGGGSVPVDNVVGRAVLLMWPFDRFEVIDTPVDVFDEVGGVEGVR